MIEGACSGIQANRRESPLCFQLNRLNLRLDSLLGLAEYLFATSDYDKSPNQRSLTLLTVFHTSQVHVIYMTNTHIKKLLTELRTTKQQLLFIYFYFLSCFCLIFFIKIICVHSITNIVLNKWLIKCLFFISRYFQLFRFFLFNCLLLCQKRNHMKTFNSQHLISTTNKRR